MQTQRQPIGLVFLAHGEGGDLKIIMVAFQQANIIAIMPKADMREFMQN